MTCYRKVANDNFNKWRVQYKPRWCPVWLWHRDTHVVSCRSGVPYPIAEFTSEEDAERCINGLLQKAEQARADRIWHQDGRKRCE